MIPAIIIPGVQKTTNNLTITNEMIPQELNTADKIQRCMFKI